MRTFGEWRFTADREATIAAYSRAAQGDATRCKCSGCKNFIAVRDKALPEEFRTFLESLGVDPTKEAEVYHEGSVSSDSHYYGGWYHFVGNLENDGDFAPITFPGGFISYMCKNSAPSLPELENLALVQIEFRAQNVPWAIEEEPL
jgi:hypothetical protein